MPPQRMLSFKIHGGYDWFLLGWHQLHISEGIGTWLLSCKYQNCLYGRSVTIQFDLLSF